MRHATKPATAASLAAAKGPSELTRPANLCLPDGTLDPGSLGWSRRPLLRANLPAWNGRRKRWNYWCVTWPGHALAVVFADVDYLSLVAASLLSIESGELIEEGAVFPGGSWFALADTTLPAPGQSRRLSHRGGRLRVSVTERDDGTLLEAILLRKGRPCVSAEVTLELPPGHETINVVVPWGSRQFQLNSKHCARPARGVVRAGSVTHVLSPERGAMGGLDWGRGIWPYRTAWNWAQASGIAAGQQVGVNLGGRWTDGTGATENGLCVGGRVTKIHDDLTWLYDARRPMLPWRVRSPGSDRVDVTITPRLSLPRRHEALLLGSRLAQVWGDFTGHIRDEAGDAVRLEGLAGWAEEHVARW